jgi:1,4-dihydroxy-6-naphthoate synthase
MPSTLEIAVDSARDALAAAPFAHRIELCANLAAHGTTPSPTLIREVASALRALPPAARPRLVALIRPHHTLTRPPDAAFTADAADLAILSREIEQSIDAGADELCIGLITPRGDIDAPACKQLRRIDESRVIAFHRAFDIAAASNAAHAIATLSDLGFQRTLAAGAPSLDVRSFPLATRLANLTHLATLASPHHLHLIACGGIRPTNAASFAAITPHLHASCRNDSGTLDVTLAGGIRGLLVATEPSPPRSLPSDMTSAPASSAAARISLTLAHSGDPDDVFMWWPITGKVLPDGTTTSGPVISTGRFTFRAVPGDISAFNRDAARPASEGGPPHDITALSVRAYADVSDRYVLSRCGSSFGEGYGPKLVCRAGDESIHCFNCLKPAKVRIAVPGKRTSAFLTMGLLLGKPAMEHDARFIEMPFDQIIPAVSRGQVDAGLVIHEGQVTFADAGLREVEDLGRWWGSRTGGLPLPLGVNAIRTELEARHGKGTLLELSDILSNSLNYALAHWDESIDATMPFAILNAKTSGMAPPSRERVEHYVRMYVTKLTSDMGEKGRSAIERLLEEGASAGLCTKPESIRVV